MWRGGVYKVPAGKALIITSVNFVLDAVSPTTEGTGLILIAGPSAHPCKPTVSRTVASAFAPTGTDFASVDQVYPSGIPIPGGDALGLAAGVNDAGLATIYGYLVPAAAVPHNALQHVAPGDLAEVKPPH